MLTISTCCIPHLLIDSYCVKQTDLLIIILSLISNNIEELKTVLSLSSANNTKPIAQLLLLQELLRKVLQVTTRKLLVCHDLNTSIAEVVHGDVIAEVTGAAVDFDALLEESRESGWVEDAVLGGLGGVDDELLLKSRVSCYSEEKEEEGSHVRTFWVTFEPFFCAPAAEVFFCKNSYSAYCSMPETANQGVTAGSKAIYILLRQPY